MAAGKKVLRVTTGSAPVLLQTGTGVADTNEVAWAGRTITGRNGGMDITSFLICNWHAKSTHNILQTIRVYGLGDDC